MHRGGKTLCRRSPRWVGAADIDSLVDVMDRAREVLRVGARSFLKPGIGFACAALGCACGEALVEDRIIGEGDGEQSPA